MYYIHEEIVQQSFRIEHIFKNQGSKDADLEMFESFSLGGLSPYMEGDGYETLQLYRLRSVWSQEGRLEVIPAEDLQLEIGRAHV